MINYEMSQIRNIAFLGHRGSGKTSLVESLLFMSSSIRNMGSVDKGTTVSDFDKEEIKRGFSINTSLIPMEFKGHKYNILDTPGYFDFVGEVLSAVKVAGSGVIVVDAEAGIEVGTEKAWDILEEANMPRFIFLNKMDKDIKNFNGLLEELKAKFGKKVAPFCIPIMEDDHFKGFVNVIEKIGRVYNGKECVDAPIPDDIDIEPVRNMLLEAVAEVDEEYMNKFFEGEEFTIEEIRDGLHRGVVKGDIVPVIVGSSMNNTGVLTLFDMMYTYMPTPNEMFHGIRIGKTLDGREVKREMDEKGSFAATVFKTFVDPFMGKISLFKVHSGTIKKDMEVLNSTKNKKERIANIMFIRGGQQITADEVRAGDIGATTKLQYTGTGDTICSKDDPIIFDGIDFPRPAIEFAIEPKNKSDDEKLSTVMHKISEEDPTIVLSRNLETKDFLIGCQGEKHLAIALSRGESKFGVHAVIKEPKVAYKETIRKTVQAEGKHRKQSGGAGQFGHVFIKFEPIPDGFQFAEDIHGGTVPKTYFPAVEKGLLEAKEKGILAGYPVINFKATLYDGSYHDVDSNEISFKMAAILSFKKAMETGSPVILEPIMKMYITVPEEYLGDVMGDLNKRRGKILGQEAAKNGKQQVLAEVPQNEILKYALDLRSMTQGRGVYHYEFAKYAEVVGPMSDKIIAEAAKLHKHD